MHAEKNLSSRNLSLAPNHNPLYNPTTTPHQPSPRNSSPLARIITCHMVRFCIMVHLCSSPSGYGLIRVYKEVRCKSWDLAAVPGAILGLLPHPLLTSPPSLLIGRENACLRLPPAAMPLTHHRETNSVGLIPVLGWWQGVLPVIDYFSSMLSHSWGDLPVSTAAKACIIKAWALRWWLCMWQMHQKARMLINIRHRASPPIPAHSFKWETAVSNPKLLQHPRINYSQLRQFVRNMAAAMAALAEIAIAVTMAVVMPKIPLRSKQSHSRGAWTGQGTKRGILVTTAKWYSDAFQHIL